MRRRLSVLLYQSLLLGLLALTPLLRSTAIGAPSHPLSQVNVGAIMQVTGEVPEAKTLVANIEKFNNSVNSCNENQLKALNDCDETKSSYIQKAVGIGKDYGNIAMMFVPTSDTCNKMEIAAKGINLALQMYKGACGSAKSNCDDSCGSATAAVQTIVNLGPRVMDKLMAIQKPENAAPFSAAIAQIQNAVAIAKTEAVETQDGASVASKRSYCAVTAPQMMAYGNQNQLMAMQMLGQGLNCTKATKTAADNSEAFCSMNPTAQQCNCNLPNQANTQRCICEKDPRNPGCANNLAKPGTAGISNMKVGGSALTTPDQDPALSPGMEDMAGEEAKLELPKTAAPGQEGGGGMGGGMAGAGGGSPNQMDKPQGGGSGGSKAYQSSLGGWGSSSGGGNGFGGGGRGSMDPKDPLAKYAPGQQFDPKRKISSLGFASGQVSSQGGKSNWEKVKQRYSDQTPTLLGN